MKLCVSKFIFSFLILLGLSRPLYAMHVDGLYISTYSRAPHELSLIFSEKQVIEIKFNNADEKKNF